MAPCCLLRFLVLCYFPLLLLAQSGIKYYGKCPLSYHCKEKFFDFPFSDTASSECGLRIMGCDDPFTNPLVQLGNQKWYDFSPSEEDKYSIMVRDEDLQKLLSSNSCSAFEYNIPPFPRSIMPFQITNMITLYKCNRALNVSSPVNWFNYTGCHDYDIYYPPPYDINYPPPQHDYSFHSCSEIQLPIDPRHPPNVTNLFAYLSSELHITVNLSEECVECYKKEDTCLDEGKFYCGKDNKQKSENKAATGKSWIWKVILGSLIFGMIIVALIIYKRRRTSSAFKYQSRNISGDPHLNRDLESNSVFFGIPVFSYKELEEATNNFDRTRELGEGGFGTVYHGKLQDGREVAVKRLYEHNYKRVQQFMTEIEILTRLRHRNLVTLYGCTSRHCRELLLVYEYIPNGTVACHLHGDLAKPGSLSWPVRMKIAIETASALAYLHASDTIHRDVKTNNILLDNHFCVKVADFGLSRLFPNDVTHVSTAPQGTPGYLDPEYYQCYQLTNKSDVYSFGVVLIELISSMPAVDITRLRDEINLANLAIKKIKNSALSELVDPSLGFESDNEVKRMIVSVAELAFQCLQLDRELRPAMDHVLKMLERIENGGDEQEPLEEEDIHEVQMSNSNVHPPPSLSPEHDEVRPLKNLKPPGLHQTL